MIVVTNTIKVKKGHGEEVASRFGRSKGVQFQPGFVRMEVLLTQGLEEYDELKVCTTWADKAAFEGWVSSDNFKEAHVKRAAEQQSSQEAGNESVILGSKMTTHSVLVTRLAGEE
ncbi:antibiotic biosynthesis monooxygenase [Paenibacillus sp. GCM10027626]|uniref:antibiotic biosynthesis monooxygenase n=1 Tax=Paenibacillus sp. GCM10027626 TaxID=3273411 RepID=UPI0036415D7F